MYFNKTKVLWFSLQYKHDVHGVTVSQEESYAYCTERRKTTPGPTERRLAAVGW